MSTTPKIHEIDDDRSKIPPEPKDIAFRTFAKITPVGINHLVRSYCILGFDEYDDIGNEGKDHAYLRNKE